MPWPVFSSWALRSMVSRSLGLLGFLRRAAIKIHDRVVQYPLGPDEFAVGLCREPVGNELQGIEAIADVRERNAVRFADGVGIAGYIGAEEGGAGNAHSDFHHAVGNIDRLARAWFLPADEGFGAFNHERGQKGEVLAVERGLGEPPLVQPGIRLRW